MRKKPVNAPEIRLDAIEFSERLIRFRMPFRYGIVTVCGAPQSFVGVRILDSTEGSATGRAREIDRFVQRRGGHQYSDGMGATGQSVRDALAADHPDPYEISGGRLNLKIVDRMISLASLNRPEYGT